MNADTLIGQRVRLEGHFPGIVRLEALERDNGLVQVRVRKENGALDETWLAEAELDQGVIEPVGAAGALVAGDDLFDLIESHRIELAFAHDPNFAVSLSGVRGLPHQIVAVYRHMLPQARLRFVLADDPGAGKTIMAGLLAKELRLRGVVDRVLVLCPAPLTIQWQEELAVKFDERFEVLSSHQVKWQLGGNPWQQTSRAIASMDFAKRDEVLPELLLADWDLVIVDEAHKASADTSTSGDGSEYLDRTKRYALVEQLSQRTERLLLMTATPHSGDADRFQNFLKLLDPDQFAVDTLTRQQIGRDDSPYFLRRQKEDLRDETGAKLFVEREVKLQPFDLSAPELALYEAVGDYIRRFLGAQPGRRGNAIALARTVMQRRLASSLGAIESSLRKRRERIANRIDEVERLPPGQRAAKLAELSILPDFDSEQDVDDAEEDQRDLAVEGVVVAETLDAMRLEIKELESLVRQAEQARAAGEEAKLTALRRCLDHPDLRELRDGRAKLLIFTEHRDTLDYLERHLRAWGFETCTIHGGMAPIDRRQVQQDFHQHKQVCVATEAAGEGINLQFCHLMVNYDLPWNPVRLEQRMGRIHRIGQEKTCVIFNFCAQNTIEGQLLSRLLVKLEEMREALGGRVYDVVGEVLQRNDVDFERLMRETLLNPRQRIRSQETIEELTAEKLLEYEQLVGIAQARESVDMGWVRERDWESEERRLMPEFVETFFRRTCEQLGVRLERRADGMWRIENVPRSVRSDRLRATQRLGMPQQTYRKLTFLKEQRARAEHEDAVLLSPGHPLFAAASEALRDKLAGAEGAAAPFYAPWARAPYPIHFFAYRIDGLATTNAREEVYAELVAVGEGPNGLERVPADVLHDLTPAEVAAHDAPATEAIRLAESFVRSEMQLPAVARRRAERLEQANLRRDYLVEAFDAQQQQLELQWSKLEERVYRGDEASSFARDQAARRITELTHRRDDKLQGFERLGIVRPGALAYLGTALVMPPQAVDDELAQVMRNDPEVEAAAMRWAMEEERAAGWSPIDVSHRRDGSGFDIRSTRRAGDGREEVRRIEVKGRGPARGDVSLCRTEWIAARRHGDSFWLYVLYGATSGQPRGVKIQNPYRAVGDRVEEVATVTAFRVPGEAIEGSAA